ncbi:unnamed protein product [Closterium sp. NIES-54]
MRRSKLFFVLLALSLLVSLALAPSCRANETVAEDDDADDDLSDAAIPVDASPPGALGTTLRSETPCAPSASALPCIALEVISEPKQLLGSDYTLSKPLLLPQRSQKERRQDIQGQAAAGTGVEGPGGGGGGRGVGADVGRVEVDELGVDGK